MRQLHEFAIRFDPPNHSHRVPLDVYAPAMEELQQGFASLRAALVPILARRRRLARNVVQEALVVHIRTNERGSNVALLDIGPKDYGPQMGIDYDPGLSAVFWKYGGELLLGAARNTEAQAAAPISATCAEHFARAGDIAAGNSVALELSERTSRGGSVGSWRPTVNITTAREGLRRYAYKRREQLKLSTQIIGTLVEICASPFHFKLQTVDGRITIAADMSMSRKIHSLWNQDVVVTVDALITTEGQIAKPHAIELDPVVQSVVILDDYIASRGTGRDIWSSDGADEYLDSLRGGDA